MQLAVYVIYELLIRVQELNPEAGEYVSYKKISGGVAVRTTTGSIEIPDHLLTEQFNNPASIKEAEILALMESFKP